MKFTHLNLYARFFLLFTVTTFLLALLIVLGSVAMTEQEAKKVVLDRQAALFTMMENLVSGPIDIESLNVEAKKNRVAIQITRGDAIWFTGDKLPMPSELMSHAEPLGQLYFTKVGARYFVFTQSNNTTIAVTSHIANIIVYNKWLVYWPWAAAMFVLFISYSVLTRQLKPIQSAIDSATQISKGNLDFRIKNHPNNDLGRLTKGLNTMAENLEQLFASKNELLLSVSHELRSPMARMKVLLALLTGNDTVSKINGEITKMDEIVEQLLESERLRDSTKLLNLETYFFPNVLTETLLHFAENDNVKLENTLPEIAIDIDLARFKFVIRNLIENGLKHSNEHSPVLISCYKNNNTLTICVRDFGEGIDAHFLPQIFEPFTQAEHVNNRSNQGIGLGLFLCKRIALAHGGDLSVESTLGNGSEFTFTIPTVT